MYARPRLQSFNERPGTEPDPVTPTLASCPTRRRLLPTLIVEADADPEVDPAEIIEMSLDAETIAMLRRRGLTFDDVLAGRVPSHVYQPWRRPTLNRGSVDGATVAERYTCDDIPLLASCAPLKSVACTTSDQRT